MQVIFVDTESTDLHASWGRILCASFVGLKGTANEKPWTLRGDTRPYMGRRVADDERLVKGIKEEIEKADIICTWNGIMHDFPLLNARLAKFGYPPIKSREDGGPRHLDMMFYAGGTLMKIGGRRLDTVAKYFKCPHQKTPLDGETWQHAGTGDREAMDQVVEHCEFDVLVLQDLWPVIAPRVKKWKFSLGDVYNVIDQI